MYAIDVFICSESCLSCLNLLTYIRHLSFLVLVLDTRILILVLLVGVTTVLLVLMVMSVVKVMSISLVFVWAEGLYFRYLFLSLFLCPFTPYGGLKDLSASPISIYFSFSTSPSFTSAPGLSGTSGGGCDWNLTTMSLICPRALWHRFSNSPTFDLSH